MHMSNRFVLYLSRWPACEETWLDCGSRERSRGTESGALSSTRDGRWMGWDRWSVDGEGQHHFSMCPQLKCIQSAPLPSRAPTACDCDCEPSWAGQGQPHHCCRHHTTTPCSLATISHSMPALLGSYCLYLEPTLSASDPLPPAHLYTHRIHAYTHSHPSIPMQERNPSTTKAKMLPQKKLQKLKHLCVLHAWLRPIGIKNKEETTGTPLRRLSSAPRLDCCVVAGQTLPSTTWLDGELLNKLVTPVRSCRRRPEGAIAHAGTVTLPGESSHA